MAQLLTTVLGRRGLTASEGERMTSESCYRRLYRIGHFSYTQDFKDSKWPVLHLVGFTSELKAWGGLGTRLVGLVLAFIEICGRQHTTAEEPLLGSVTQLAV